MLHGRLNARRLQSWAGNAMLAIGIALLAATALMYGYGQYERLQYERTQADRDRADGATATVEALRVVVETATSKGLATATARAEATASAVEATAIASRPTATPVPPGVVAPPTPVPTATRTPVPPTATPTRAPVTIKKILAPAIGLDAEVVESKLVDGEWQVPKFVAGHLQGTAMPGDGSNVVLSGHVQSISSGNVFAGIDRLAVGDEVTLRTNDGDVVYRIGGKNVVKNDDLSVVQPTRSEEITLITCTGWFNPVTQDYTERWVVWGSRVA